MQGVPLFHSEGHEPQEHSPSKCLFKVKGQKFSYDRVNFDLEVADGVLYDCSAGIQVMSKMDYPRVFVDQHLPEVLNMEGRYQSCVLVGLWNDLNNPGSKQYSSIDFSMGNVKFFVSYFGIRIRIFKYFDKVYLLTEDRMDGKSCLFNGKGTAWDVFCSVTCMSPEEMFDKSTPTETSARNLSLEARAVRGQHVQAHRRRLSGVHLQSHDVLLSQQLLS